MSRSWLLTHMRQGQLSQRYRSRYKLSNRALSEEPQYITEDNFKEEMSNWASQSLGVSLFHMNARGLTKHLEEINLLANDNKFKFTFICFSETWVNNETTELCNLKGYTSIHNYRKTKAGGGVSIHIREDISGSVLHNMTFSTKHMESIFVRINKGELRNSKDLIVGCVYRPPNGDCKIFLDNYQDIQFDNIGEVNCLICGDFNIDLNARNTKVEQFRNVNTASNFTPIINKVTRSQKSSNTIIDNIFTNNSYSINKSGIIISDISDHYPIFITSNCEQKLKTKENPKLSRNKYNTGNFIENIKQTDWNAVLNLQDTERAYNTIHQNVDALQKSSSVTHTTKNRYSTHLPCLTGKLKSLIKHKNKFYIKANMSRLDSDIKLYKQSKRIVNREMKHAKRQYYDAVLNEKKGDIKYYWKILKEIIGKDVTETYPSYFIDDFGNRNENYSEISTTFNKYFVNVGPNLASKIPEAKNNFSQYLKDRNTSTIFLEPTTPEEIRNIIIALKDATAGWDSINKFILINILDYIILPLTHIINLSIEQGIFPSKLKIAKIRPIYKAGNKHFYSNYRPISLLTTISKIFEKVIHKRFISFLTKFDILYSKQFGFRTGKRKETHYNRHIPRLFQGFRHGKL